MRLFNFYSDASRMAGKFGSVHALERGQAEGHFSFMGSHDGVFQDIGTFWQVVHKVVGSQVAGAFVITQTALVAVAT